MPKQMESPDPSDLSKLGIRTDDFFLPTYTRNSFAPNMALESKHRPFTGETSLVVFAVLALSCASGGDKSNAAPAPAARPPTLQALPEAATTLDAAIADTRAPSKTESPLPPESQQLIVTVTDGWQGTDAALHRFERDKEGKWQTVGTPFDTTIGRTGLAWGRGLHAASARPGDPEKVEGDGKSPAGVFAVGALYGYDKAFSGTTQLDYQEVDKTWRCVNDSNSSHYNRVLSSKGVKKDWQEAEKMRRRDELYRLVVAIDHNAIFAGEPVADGGSCIFFHVWRRAGAPTIGCTAMPLGQMEMLASWLAPKSSPVLVALPRERYRELQAGWQLPPL